MHRRVAPISFSLQQGRHLIGRGGRNDTYGSARTAQPGRSQRRPPTNTGSQPTEQDRPAHPASLPAPLSRTVAPYASHPPTEWRGSGGTGSADIFTPVTNAIESINARYRRAVKARGHFPTEQAALQCLYLVT